MTDPTENPDGGAASNGATDARSAAVPAAATAADSSAPGGPLGEDRSGAADRQTVYFNELAELFAIFAEDTDVLYRPWLTSVLPSSGGRAVDLGCGSGRWIGLLTDRYDDVLGVDISDREIEMAGTSIPTSGSVSGACST